jgi:hypothetical protein
MNDWKLLGLIASKEGSQDELAEIICRENFKGRYQSQDAALMLFEMTPDNAERNHEAAAKLSSLEVSGEWGFRAKMRHSILRELVAA